MIATATANVPRRPRFRRAAQPPPFRLTEDDVTMVRLLARHRFLRSIHIAALVGRSVDRTNSRLSKLFHAGYIDRPRAQLDYYPTSGSAPIAYALADSGARLLIQRDGKTFSNLEWSRKNREAGRPYIEHQLEVMDFYVSLQCCVRQRNDVRLIQPDELIAAFPNQDFVTRNPCALRVPLMHNGVRHEVGLVPDLIFGLMFEDGSRRCFMVEIDRGTMPIVRGNFFQTSYERKMRAYLTVQAAELHERHFGWKAFRVLTITTDEHRARTIRDSLTKINVPHSLGPQLFFFATRDEIAESDPIGMVWRDGRNRNATLL